VKTRLRRTAAVAALVVSLGALATGCDLAILHPGAGGTTANACPQGTWTLDSESVATKLPSFLGNATITPSGSGVKLVVGTGNDWTLTADQTVRVVVDTPSIDATATVKGTATGTYTVSGSKLTFTLGNVTGDVKYSATAFGQTYSGSVALPKLGELAKMWALDESATFSCATNGDLGLKFGSFGMHLHD
jgi:hypothetical protein